MPLTQQIIETIVRDQVKEGLKPVKSDLKALDGKIDRLERGTDEKFDEEQVVQGGQISDLTDRVEKLELVIN